VERGQRSFFDLEDRLRSLGGLGDPLEGLDPDNEDPTVWAGSACRSEETEANLAAAEYDSPIHEQGQAHRPFDGAAQERNRARPKIRARVEDVFGYRRNRLGGTLVGAIGQARAELKIRLTNLTRNVKRDLVPIRPGTGACAA
jgi:hypothetical protein